MFGLVGLSTATTVPNDKHNQRPFCKDRCDVRLFASCGKSLLNLAKPNTLQAGGAVWCCPAEVRICLVHWDWDWDTRHKIPFAAKIGRQMKMVD
jgi:hypothetical protein